MSQHFVVVSKENRKEAALTEGPEHIVRGWLCETSDPSDYEVYSKETGYIPAEEFLTQEKTFILSDELVSKFYVMNPQTDELLPTGRYLKDGMVVLIEAADRRTNVSRELPDWENHRALHNNRWSLISDVKQLPDHDIVSFVSTYADGTKFKRQFSSDYAWLVKKETIPTSEAPEKKFEAVLELVKEAMGADYEETYWGEKNEIASDIAKGVIELREETK